MKNLKIGLVLGGGGARGLAHIGVIRGLLKNQIPVHCISGVSMGAIVGAAFALLTDIQKVEHNFKNFLFSDKFKKLKGESIDLSSAEKPEGFFHFLTHIVKKSIVINLAANRRGLVDARRLRRAVQYVVPRANIEETAIPFACSALNLVDGREYVFRRGDLHTALVASSSIPGYLPPVRAHGGEFVDGAVINGFPVQLCKELGADFTIVCDVSPGMGMVRQFKNILDIFIRSHRAVVHRLNEELLKQADFVLKPPIGEKNWTDFEAIDFFIQQGEAVVEQNIHLLKEKIKQRSSCFFSLKKKIFVV